MSFCFPASHRIKSNSQFQGVFRDAKKVSRNGFHIFLKQNSLDFSRLGIVISKRCVKKAVDRNKFKRIIRESFRLSRNNLRKYDFVFLARRNLQNMEKEVLRQDLESIWC